MYHINKFYNEYICSGNMKLFYYNFYVIKFEYFGAIYQLIISEYLFEVNCVNVKIEHF